MKHIYFLFNHEYTTHARVPRQVTALLSNNYRVSVICFATPELPKIEKDGNLTIHRLFKRRIYKYHMFSLRTLKFFIKLACRLPRPDIIHVNNAPMLLLGFLLSKLWNTKLVYDSAELWDALYDEEKERLLNNKDISSKELKNKLKQIERSRAFEGWVMSHCNGILTVNHAIREKLEQKAGKRLQNCAVIRNIPKFQTLEHSDKLRQHFNIPKERKIILYQGLIAEKRGLREALDIIERLDNVALVLMGSVFPSETEFFESQMKRVETCPKLQNRVFFRGFIPPGELLSWTASADLGLQPILNWNMNHYLCLPNKIFEYLQAGLPIAASNFPEMKRIISEYQIGILFDPKEPDYAAKQIQNLLTNSEMQNTYRMNIQKAKHELCWENEEKLFINLYKQLLQDNKPCKSQLAGR